MHAYMQLYICTYIHTFAFPFQTSFTRIGIFYVDCAPGQGAYDVCTQNSWKFSMSRIAMLNGKNQFDYRDTFVLNVRSVRCI